MKAMEGSQERWKDNVTPSCILGASVVKDLPANARDTGDLGSILGWG